MRAQLRSSARRFCVAVAVLPLGACTTPSAMVAAHARGDFEAARQQVLAPSLDRVKNEARDRLLWLVEEGKICLDAGDAACAAKAFAQASDWGERYAIYEPKTTIQEEMASIAWNSTARTFRGTYSDRILVDAYAVLANLWTGDTAKAVVYANRVTERQTDAEVEQARQIAKVSREIEGYRGGAVGSMVKEVRESAAMRAVGVSPAEAAYLNPFASWISAMAWSATLDGPELERSSTALSRAAAMVPSNPLLAQQAASNPFVVARRRPQVLVLFEAGRCVSLRQVMIPVFTPWSGFNPIPIPVPQPHPCEVASLAIRADATHARTLPLSDNDAIFMAQYDRMLPEIVFRTALMVGAKAGATVAATQAVRGDDAATIGVLLGMSLYQAVSNQADLRSWRTVGKFTQIAQLDRPADGRLAVAVTTTFGTTGPEAIVDLPDAPVVFLYVRSVSPSRTVIYTFPVRERRASLARDSGESNRSESVRSPA